MTEHQGAGNCQKCSTVEDQYRTIGKDKNFFIVHAERRIVKGKNCPEKKQTLDKLTTRVSALRNSRGGAVLVHLNGQEKKDRFLQYFDEFIAKTFCDLIENGEAFVNTYTRQWLDVLPEFTEFADFVLVKVQRTRGIATIDFNTKFRKDFENESPSTLNILKLLSKTPSPLTTTARLQGLTGDVQLLHECRNIEHKAFWPKPDILKKIEDNADEFVNYIWCDLKLKDNVTSMSKLKDGGSIYFGILEANDISTGSKIPGLHGFVLVDKQPVNGEKRSPRGKQIDKCPEFQIRVNRQDFQTSLDNKIRSDLSLLNGSGVYTDVPQDILTFEFHKILDTNPPKYILEVAVRYVDGVLFYDKRGPRTYTIVNKRICRMDKEVWLRRLQALDISLGSQTRFTS